MYFVKLLDESSQESNVVGLLVGSVAVGRRVVGEGEVATGYKGGKSLHELDEGGEGE